MSDNFCVFAVNSIVWFSFFSLFVCLVGWLVGCLVVWFFLLILHRYKYERSPFFKKAFPFASCVLVSFLLPSYVCFIHVCMSFCCLNDVILLFVRLGFFLLGGCSLVS